MAAESDFIRFMDRLRRGDEDAAAEVFCRFGQRLIALARSQLDSWIRTRVEPDDVIQSVFRSFFTRVKAEQFQLGDWDNLWTVLTLITVRKCANRSEFWRAAKRDLQRVANLLRQQELLEDLLDREPTPLEAAMLSETLEQLVKNVSARDQLILAAHLRGHDITTISEQAGVTERTVRRTLERLRQTLLRLNGGAEESL